MTDFIICLLALSHLGVGYLWRISLVRTSNGYRSGLVSAAVCVTLWPLFGMAELGEWAKERMA